MDVVMTWSHHCAVSLSPKHPMSSPLQRLRDGLLRFLCVPASRERADAFHQIEPQSKAELVWLPRCELPACFVLGESLLRRVGGLANVEWCEGTWVLRAGAGEFDDVNGVGAARSHRFPTARVTRYSSGSITLAAAPLPLGLRRRGSRTPTGGTPPVSGQRENIRRRNQVIRRISRL